MGLVLVTAPAEEPVSATLAKLHARVDHTADDTLFDAFITAARQLIEHHTRRQLVTATYDLKLDSFAAGCVDDCWPRRYSPERLPAGEIELLRPPVQSITSITYVDPSGNTQTLDAAAYQLDKSEEPARLRPAYSYAWPSTREQFNAVIIRYVCGYGAASAVPASLKTALLLLVAHWYEHREAVPEAGIQSAPLPLGVEALIAPYRLGTYP